MRILPLILEIFQHPGKLLFSSSSTHTQKINFHILIYSIKLLQSFYSKGTWKLKITIRFIGISITEQWKIHHSFSFSGFCFFEWFVILWLISFMTQLLIFSIIHEKLNFYVFHFVGCSHISNSMALLERGCLI